jgi:hypothetical protein
MIVFSFFRNHGLFTRVQFHFKTATDDSIPMKPSARKPQIDSHGCHDGQHKRDPQQRQNKFHIRS